MSATVQLTRTEGRVIRRGLKRLRHEVKKSIAKNIATGWQPEPGCLDLGRETLIVVNDLLNRLPYPDQEQVS